MLNIHFNMISKLWLVKIILIDQELKENILINLLFIYIKDFNFHQFLKSQLKYLKQFNQFH